MTDHIAYLPYGSDSLELEDEYGRTPSEPPPGPWYFQAVHDDEQAVEDRRREWGPGLVLVPRDAVVIEFPDRRPTDDLDDAA